MKIRSIRQRAAGFGVRKPSREGVLKCLVAFDAVFPEVRFVFKQQQIHDFTGGFLGMLAGRARVGIAGGVECFLEPVDSPVVHGGGDELILDQALVFPHHQGHDVAGGAGIACDVDLPRQGGQFRRLGGKHPGAGFFVDLVSKMGQGTPARDIITAPALPQRAGVIGLECAR